MAKKKRVRNDVDMSTMGTGEFGDSLSEEFGAGVDFGEIESEMAAKKKLLDSKRCTVPGCKGFKVTNSDVCIGHINRDVKGALKQLRQDNKQNKRNEYKEKIAENRAIKALGSKIGLAQSIQTKNILSREHFNLEIERDLFDESSGMGAVDSKDPLDLPLMKQKLFARWLNADDLTRVPQNQVEVAKILKVSLNTLVFWRQSVVLRKIMSDELDNAMKYDARKIAYEGLLKLMVTGDAKAVDRYMQMFVDKTKVVVDDNENEWVLDKIEDLPDDVHADRKDKLIRSVHKDIGLKLVEGE